jgi:hypothetical protein
MVEICRVGIIFVGSAKMKKTGIFKGMFIIMLLFGTFTVDAQTFSNNFNENYQVFGLGYAEKPTAKALFLDSNLITRSVFGIRAMWENKSTTNGVFTATMLLTRGSTRYARLTVSVRSDDFTKQNYLTYFGSVFFSNGKSMEYEYDGTQGSLKKILEAFSHFIDLFYDKSKLFSGSR